jgi:CRISPR-associated endonuclease/helicase Cas3
MTPERLAAKSARSGRPALSLAQHLLDTDQAAAAVFRLDGRWGRAWCRFFRIPEPDWARWLLNLRIAALFHDIGKANRDFFDAVTSRSAQRQTLRHEHLSALILHLPAVRRWLGCSSALDVEAITAAVLSHHMKASETAGPPGQNWKWAQPVGANGVDLFLQHPEVVSILERVGQLAGLPPAPLLTEEAWRPTAPWDAAILDGQKTAREFRRQLRADAQRRSFMLAVKAAVVVADSVASGLVREGHPIEAWIDDVVHRAPLAAETIREEVLAEKQRQLEQRHQKPFLPHRFQDLASRQGPRALLLAGCGTGKTLAAWRWAEAQARERIFGRVIFLYPTRGTATEGFRDYVSWAPDAALLHGTSRYELEAMSSNPEERGSNDPPIASQDTERLFALGYWPMKYFSATVDQFMGFLEHSYASTCLLPALADSVVIIDEVHSFDSKMFEGLIAFLRAFDVPVLCMTATLNTSRRVQLEDAGLRVFPAAEERAELADLESQETHLRYELECVQGRDTAFEEAARAFEAGLRVLVVVNRVAECQAWVRRLEQRIGEKPRCYHSRFRLCDRQRVHGETVKAFQQRERPTIAVTTQVCEMSLDLDADVLVTEMAPPSALIQRFGRANRHRARGAEFRARLVVYAPSTHLPYEKDELAAARSMLDSLGRAPLSQRMLSQALEAHAPGEARARESASFLEGGYYAVSGSFRDIDQQGARCVLDRDLDDVLACLRNKRPYDGFVLSVPPRTETQDGPAELPQFLRVVSAKGYDSDLGYVVEAS